MTESPEARPTYSPSRRLDVLDAMKGMGIFGVVLVHVVILYVLKGDGGSADDVPLLTEVINSLTTAVMEMLYAALMGFFVITGYFFRPGRPYGEYVKRRIIPLTALFVACVVVLNSAMYAYLTLLGYDFPFDEFLVNLGQLLVGKEPFVEPYGSGEFILELYECTHQLYFLQALVLASVVFYATAARVVSNIKVLAATILVLLVIQGLYVSLVYLHLPFNAELVPISLSALYFGAYLGKNKAVERFLSMERGRMYWGIFAAVVISGVLLFAVFPTRMCFIYCYFGKYGGFSVFPFFAAEMLGVIFLAYLSSWLIKVRFLGSALLAMGRNCLAIFVLHMFFVKLVIAPFVDLDYELWVPFGPPLSLLVVVSSILLSICAAKLLKPAADGICNRFSR